MISTILHSFLDHSFIVLIFYFWLYITATITIIIDKKYVYKCINLYCLTWYPNSRTLGKANIHAFRAYIKPGFHTCVSRTHNNERCLAMYGHQMITTITAFATKACDFAHVELLRELALWYAVTVIYRNQQRNKKNFLSSQKKRAKPKTKK